MFKKYISKFTIDILPSILATIVGAYIVNHYIIPKAGADKPAAAVASTPSESKPDNSAASAKPAENSSDLANVPEPTPAKAGDKPAIEKASIEKPESATAPEPRRHQPSLREKAVAKATPAPVAPVPAAPAPVLATVGTAPTANASADERRDANDLARAAIERLNRNEPRTQEAARTPEAPRAPEAPRVQEAARTAPAPSMQQLPPPILVTTPSVEKFDSMPSPQSERSEARRIRPPGEIPAPQPMDLQASAAATPRSERTNVAEDVLSAAKSVFNSVIPHPFER